jgi:hypothetical protein
MVEPIADLLVRRAARDKRLFAQNSRFNTTLPPKNT